MLLVLRTSSILRMRFVNSSRRSRSSDDICGEDRRILLNYSELSPDNELTMSSTMSTPLHCLEQRNMRYNKNNSCTGIINGNFVHNSHNYYYCSCRYKLPLCVRSLNSEKVDLTKILHILMVRDEVEYDARVKNV